MQKGYGLVTILYGQSSRYTARSKVPLESALGIRPAA
jgi:hypothetical protein